MGINTSSWERELLTWAYQGYQDTQALRDHACTERADDEIARAYEICAEMTYQHSRTFHMASGLLPTSKRRAARALYAFCRTSDDLIDRLDGRNREETEAALKDWAEAATSPSLDCDDPLVLAWADTQATYHIPGTYAKQLIEGVAWDLRKTRYQTFEELAAYCYGVASTVGLMAMYIVGFSGSEAIPYAVKLGVALQLTNILRDVAEDWQMGRLYLPLDELADFEIDETAIASGEVGPRWRAFMRYQIERVRSLYAESLPGITHLHRDGRFGIGAAAELYRGILDDIETHDMDVFHRRAYVSRRKKIRHLPGIWWRAMIRGYPSPPSMPRGTSN